MTWALGYLGRTPSLWGYVIAPALVAGILASVVLWFVFAELSGYVTTVVDMLPGWLSFLSGLLQTIVFGTLLLGSYFVFLAIAAVATAPFCEMLSESIEAKLAGTEAPPFSVATLLKDVVLGLSHALRRGLAYLFVMAGLFLVSLVIPVIGAAVLAIGGAWVTIRFTSFDALDTIWARKSLPYDQKMAQLQQVRSRVYGIGAVTALLMAVPIANLLAFQLSAAAATRLYCEEFLGATNPDQ